MDHGLLPSETTRSRRSRNDSIQKQLSINRTEKPPATGSRSAPEHQKRDGQKPMWCRTRPGSDATSAACWVVGFCARHAAVLRRALTRLESSTVARTDLHPTPAVCASTCHLLARCAGTRAAPAVACIDRDGAASGE